MRFKATRLIVRPHRPGRQALLWMVVATILGTAMWIAFEYGQLQEIYARMSSLARSARSSRDGARSIDELQAENSDLKQRVTILERAAQIDKEADNQLQGHLRKLQDETYRLREELAFYRKVVGAAKDADGLRVQAIRMEPMRDAGRYQYQLVLTNLSKDDKVTAGDATIEVAGKTQGQAQKFKVTTVKDGTRTANLAFSFVHFHRVEGDFTLPAGFEPESVRIVVRQESVREPRQDTSYDWKALVQAEG